MAVKEPRDVRAMLDAERKDIGNDLNTARHGLSDAIEALSNIAEINHGQDIASALTFATASLALVKTYGHDGRWTE